MAAPGHALGPAGSRISTSGGAPGSPSHQRDAVGIAIRGQPAAKGIGIGQRRRQRGALHRRGQCLQPGQRQRQQIAALAGGEGVHLVDHHPLQAGEQRRAFGIAEQQRQRFGRGQQHVRRAGALAGLAIGRGIAAARLDADRQPDLLDRGQQVALHIVRQRLQRRDVERVQDHRAAAPRQPRGREIGQRRQEPGQRLARAGIGHQQRVQPGAAERRWCHQFGPSLMQRMARGANLFGKAHSAQTAVQQRNGGAIARLSAFAVPSEHLPGTFHQGGRPRPALAQHIGQPGVHFKQSRRAKRFGIMQHGVQVPPCHRLFPTLQLRVFGHCAIGQEQPSQRLLVSPCGHDGIGILLQPQ
jgi:hypothetical protein